MKNPRLIDMTGSVYGHWTVQEQAGNSRGGAALWRCVCACGTEKTVVGSDLRNGKSVSCGCQGSRASLGTRMKTHGQTNTRLYYCWKNMLARCRDTTNKSYGGKGVQVCAAWQSFTGFSAWALSSGYADNLTIERIDIDNGYAPDNCTWIPAAAQAKNRSIVRKTEDGRLLSEIAKENGIPLSVLNNRISSGGWSPMDAATIPVGSVRRILEKDAAGMFLPSTKKWRR